MQECGTSTGKDVYVKRVTVRSGGAGHAHSGVIKGGDTAPSATTTVIRSRRMKAANIMIVRLGG